jgi:predicted GNAT family acetyltransferase
VFLLPCFDATYRRGGLSTIYTDLANPTSNSIYQRIGYRPVEDRVVLAFFTH